MTNEASIAALLKSFRSTSRFIITSHARPDGDAVGSVLAMAEILEQLGCKTQIVLADPPPCIYESLPGVANIRVASTAGELGVPVIVLECDSTERTGLKDLNDRFLINVDHHASGRHYADINWIDEHACAVAEMVYSIAVAAEVEITASMATCLYAAVLSDTGSFTYPTTSATTFKLAHDLAAHGASPSQIARNLYFTNPESKIRLLAVALSNMQCEGPVAWSWVTDAEMERAGASAEDCEGIVNYLIGISGVESAVFLREVSPGGEFRLSIRSKGRVDVARIAESLGGGGHRSASGCTLDGPLAVATERILNQLRDGLC
ncbi:bifunctional oligoribonuclease/PAP phosphatase NrnA [Granulicella sp. dw_53]|uniref:DHH family phosphoesterase n=1 Tax=Granulicella sp. dw_53 TaxID=2719792 RepID=UPI001BD2F2CE|nr:bifunctional oligoribonuclease/PAP phosphatase NrnA [Granulicella sp. dw_53]